MKKTLMLLILACASQSQAGVDNWYHPCYFPDLRPHCTVGFFCAPEVQEGNLAATERTLDELAKGELSQEVVFKTQIAAIKKLEAAQKMAAYMSLVGVKSETEIAEFVGSRDGAIDSRYVQHLSNNTKLSQEKSEIVLKKISNALLGQRH